MITGIIDLATYYLRLSVLISWVAPRGSMVRRLLIPLPSLSVDPAMAMGVRLRVCSRSDRLPNGRRELDARRRDTYTHRTYCLAPRRRLLGSTSTSRR